MISAPVVKHKIREMENNGKLKEAALTRCASVSGGQQQHGDQQRGEHHASRREVRPSYGC